MKDSIWYIPTISDKFLSDLEVLKELDETWKSYPFTEEHIQKFYLKYGFVYLPSVTYGEHQWFRGVEITLRNWEQAILLFPYLEKHQTVKKLEIHHSVALFVTKKGMDEQKQLEMLIKNISQTFRCMASGESPQKT